MSLNIIINQLERLIHHLDEFIQQSTSIDQLPDFDQHLAIRWHHQHQKLTAVLHPDLSDISDLIGIDRQIQQLDRNTRQFLQNLPANHVLLWGDRGTGKSSLVKGLLTRYAKDALRMIEVSKQGLLFLPEIVEAVWNRPEKYILFCDDLSFSNEDSTYRELKAMLEGGVSALPENVLVYATSNRRHLMPRQVNDNKYPINQEDELYPRESTEEKVSLSDRFGLRLSFTRISRPMYLKIVNYYAKKRNLDIEESDMQRLALEWEASSSNRSGRIARQFIDDLEGKFRVQ